MGGGKKLAQPYFISSALIPSALINEYPSIS